MRTEHYALTQLPLSSSEEWQEAIEAERYPLRIASIEGDLRSDAIVHVALSGSDVAFELRMTVPEDVIRPWHRAKVPPKWRYAVSLNEVGNEQSLSR